MKLTDLGGNPVKYIAFSLDAGGESAPFSLLASPEIGDTLQAFGDVAEAQVLGLLPGGAWTDLAGGLDLNQYAGGTVEVSFKVVAAGGIVGRVRATVSIASPQREAAGWLT